MLGNRKENGIIQRALEDIFQICDPETDSIGIAFYEIYNEKVFDLLSQSSLKGEFLEHRPSKKINQKFQYCLCYKWVYFFLASGINQIVTKNFDKKKCEIQ